MQTAVYKNVDETIYAEVLDNGLKVFMIPKPDVSESYAIFTTNYGSNDITFVPAGKTEKITVPPGVAHFLEHKLFDKADYDVRAEFGKLGASCNAYTNPKQTSYLFSTTENVERCVEILLNYVQDPYFTDETVEKEKGIIIQEAQMSLDNPYNRSSMGILKALFQNHPIQYPVIGTIDSINSITKEDLYTCYHTFYHPSNMMLCITGDFDVQKMVHLIQKNQAEKQFENPQIIQRFIYAEPEAAAKAEMKITMPISLLKCTIGIKEYSARVDQEEMQHRMLLTNIVLNYLFGQSGPFYQQLYEQGLIDDSFTYGSECEQDFGYSLIQCNTDNPDEFAKCVKKLLLSANKIQLENQIFERMKKRRIGEILRSMNSIQTMADTFSYYNARGLNFFEFIPAIQKLTLNDAKQFMNNWIEADRLTVCTVKGR
ncbi:EF-P 5-aminopentanol modification-associated protein YfmH [Brevibacillus reuszeri]|uniref:EF-P 5-aminopentanol modification-associated protein YfmH n=1 Tax=Brevibacillus reuszeri TaxID=54915 RepID=UPI00289EC12C|nr:pitrilysin family protein [Brevibacillus reuszeri]